VLSGFAGSIAEAARQGLLRDSRVVRVEQDAVVQTQGDDWRSQLNATWGLDRIDQRVAPLDGAYGYRETGAGVTVYIVDTGIRYSHRDFNGRATLGVDVLGGEGDDCHGHGTHVAGTVAGEDYGVAKDAALKSVRVLDCAGSGSAADVIAGLEWVAANATGPSVVNISLGGSGDIQAMNDAVRSLIAGGIPAVVAAGNSSSDACGFSPALVAEAMTVGATDSQDRKPYWSNYGSCVDWFAPGASIVSASNQNDVSNRVMSGTSMAAPHTAGLAALYLERDPTATPVQVAEAIASTSTRNAVQNAQSPANDLVYSRLEGTGGWVNSAPTAHFTVTCTGLACEFDGSGSTDGDGVIVSWEWDFGDGSTGTGESISHAYAVDGVYTATLTVTDDEGATSDVSQPVTGNEPPIASFTSMCNGLACTFDATASHDPDGSIVSFTWDFGDGTELTGQSSRHSYSQQGVYVVALTVLDDGGAQATETRDITVTDPNGDAFTLNAVFFKFKKDRWVDLEWSGASFPNVDVFRTDPGGSRTKIATVEGYTSYRDTLGRVRKGTLIYQVCGTGTSMCSNEAEISL
jgi:PKD repeat protein